MHERCGMVSERGLLHMGNAKERIESGKAVLGIEFGSTRIKAVLVDETHQPIASGAHDWENQLVDGIWTYSLDMIWDGLRDCYRKMTEDVQNKYGVAVTKLGAIGFSGMMHGYMPFDEKGELLVPFRTWRNTITGEAAAALTKEFSFNIPQRWSIAHLYQAILNGEEHVDKIAYFTTLAGYIHWKLTGEKVLGVGEASGMFPIDAKTRDYNRKMLAQFDALPAVGKYTWKLEEILPKVLVAGENAGTLTEEGAKLLDPSGRLEAGIPLCPPEGDAGTGMVATNSVAVRTGNVSAGTSVFAMVVLEEDLKAVHEELDMVTTPSGDTVAMVHCNNCSSELDAWVKIFGEFAELSGHPVAKPALYDMLYYHALTGDPDCGDTVVYNFLSGEPVAGAENGRPMYFRTPDGKFNLANLFRAEIYSTMAALKLGMDILFDKEQVSVDKITGHGGLFKTKGVAQQFLADGLGCAVSVMKTAGEGGAWGMALLAAFSVCGGGKSLPEFLDSEVFGGMESTTLQPEEKGAEGFRKFMENYKRGLVAEYAAAK